jgi:hypothetical protein
MSFRDCLPAVAMFAPTAILAIAAILTLLVEVFVG